MYSRKVRVSDVHQKRQRATIIIVINKRKKSVVRMLRKGVREYGTEHRILCCTPPAIGTRGRTAAGVGAVCARPGLIFFGQSDGGVREAAVAAARLTIRTRPLAHKREHARITGGR